jgi:hypothetical protein
VASNVTAHNAWGVGVYSNFVYHDVTTPSGIVCPPALEKNFVNPLTVKLSGYGGITHIVNDKGTAAGGNKTSVNYLC